MDIIWKEIQRNLAQGQTLVLAEIVRRAGSAPRSAGARLLLLPDGTSLGTVGGGLLEAETLELAGEVQRTGQAQLQRFTFTGTEAASMDMICGGEVEVLIERLDAQDETLPILFNTLVQAAEAHRRAWWITTLPLIEGAPVGHALVQANGQVMGVLPSGLTMPDLQQVRLPTLFELDGLRSLAEPVYSGGTLFIFGAGHVGQSLAHLAPTVDFFTVVLDDRADFASRERFPRTDELRVIASFEQAYADLPVDEDSYIVIVTRGHLNDLTVLQQALSTPANYIGMIGSRRKVGLMIDQLRQAGFTDQALQRVHAPIGLPIAAETPEEIAVSILAELIQVRNQHAAH